MKRILLLAALLTASPAWASNGWFSNPDCTGQTTTSLFPSGVAYFCVDSSATLNAFSNVLRTDGWVIWLSRIGDRSQTTAGIGEVKVFETATVGGTAVTSSTGLDQRGADTDGDGIEDTASLNGAVSRGAINGFTATGITIQVTALPAVGEQMVIAVTGVK